MLWEHSMQGYNPHNVGMFGKSLTNIDELIDYIGTQSIYCTMRDGYFLSLECDGSLVWQSAPMSKAECIAEFFRYCSEL